MNQFHGIPPCASMIACVDKPPASRTTTSTASPAGISYEMICAAERSPPNSDHLELDDHPPRMIPTTTSAVMERI